MKTKPHVNAAPNVRIPRALRAAADLSTRQKALLATIHSGPATGCAAPNKQLSRLLNTGERQVRACLTTLRAQKLVTVEIISGNQRLVRATAKLTRLFKSQH